MNTNNHNSYILLFFFLIFLIISCCPERNLIREGFTQLRSRDYDSIKREFINESFMPEMNIWVKGNLVIQEIKVINTTDSDGVITRETPVAYYLFMDRKSKTFYNYSSFSDTARILDKYTQADTAEIRGLGGWSFYKKRDLKITDSLQPLSDTTINNIIHKRFKFKLKTSNNESLVIIYLRCDKKGTVLLFDKTLSEKLGCPIVRLDYLPTPQNPSPVSSEIVFLRDSLSKEELKVFDAWEKNIKKYPVDK